MSSITDHIDNNDNYNENQLLKNKANETSPSEDLDAEDEVDSNNNNYENSENEGGLLKAILSLPKRLIFLPFYFFYPTS